MKINWLWSFLSSFGLSFRFFGKSALFVNVSFELLPQLSFEIARGQSVWRKVALEVLLSL
ncbi:hypothetical protein AUQ44_00825 [Vibrio cidicii]|uniref:Uncharacterized protein n=1 Tax=Vibrio cidicii TaxID=1763883 RepID=A0A151JFV8_9VIBR|nr:hypothetical protein AUQ44_00825 [Vibrio cidicii]